MKKTPLGNRIESAISRKDRIFLSDGYRRSSGLRRLAGGLYWLVLSLTVTTASAQTSAYYTADRIATATFNISATGTPPVGRYTWAQSLWNTNQTGAIQKGDGVPDYYIGKDYANINVFSQQPDDFFWFLQPETVFPRYVPNESQQVSPTTGLLLSREYGFKAWTIDPIAQPYKVLDRSTATGTSKGTWYPRNDFYQYYRLGIDANGRFDPAQAASHQEYLKNVDDNSSNFVDSGSGFSATPDDPTTDEHENVTYKIYPISTYAKFVYTAYTIPLIRSLSEAAVLETDPAKKALYAHQGLILLGRLAFIYPDYRMPTSPTARSIWTYESGTGAPKTGGMITDNIWETPAFEEICLGYDAFRPFLYTDPDIVNYLYLKGVPASSAAELDTYIRTYLLQSGMAALQQHKIAGNLGMAQAAAMAAAVAFNYTGSDSVPNSKTMADLVYSGYQSVKYLMYNGLHRDGGGQESVNYNNIKLDLIRANRMMDALRLNFSSAFPTTTYPDIFAQDKARSLFDYFIDIAPLDRFTPDFGDCGTFTAPQRASHAGYLESSNFFYAWEKYDRDPNDLGKSSRYLKAAGISGTWPAGDLFEKYPEQEALAANTPVSADHVAPSPRLLDGYGVGILEQGWGDSRRTFLQNATSLMGHRQYDPLSVSLYGDNVNLLPDLGYPSTWNYRYQYDSHSMAANTVTVDETRSTMATLTNGAGETLRTGPTGAIGRLFGQAGPLQFIANSFNPYPDQYYSEPFRSRFEQVMDSSLAQSAAAHVTLYERMDAQVEIDSRRSYVVDLFSVNGGSQHDLSWHGPLVVPTDPGLSWTNQSTGSLAGPTITRFAEYIDAWGRKNLGGAFPSYLASVKKATLSSPAAWRWNTALSTQDGVTIYLVPLDGPLQVIRGKGSSPGRSTELDYLLARHMVTSGSRTRFLSVVEPFSGTSAIQSVSLVSTSPPVLEIVHATGTDHITLSSPDGSSLSTGGRNLGAHLERWALGQSSGNKCIDVQYGSIDGTSSGYCSGTINYSSYDTRTIRVPYTAEMDDACQVGRWVRIYNESRSSLYEITARSSSPPSTTTLTLDRTALLATGTVQNVVTNRVELGADLEFANGRIDSAGNLVVDPWQPRDFFAGAWLSEGGRARKLKGAVEAGSATSNTALSYLYFNTPESNPSSLQTALSGSDTNIWDYGVGDTLEIAKVQYARQITPGGNLSLPIQLAASGTQATVEVMAWLKSPTWAGYATCLKAQWDGIQLASSRPASFTMNKGTSVSTYSSSWGYSLPYIPDPIAITPTNQYYFKDPKAVYDLTKIRFTVNNPTAGNHTLVLSHTLTTITASIVVGSVNVTYSP